MTVRYTDEVATAKCGGFLKLLRRWRGSIYKLIWKDLLTFLVLYYLVAVCYTYTMNDKQKDAFGQFVVICHEFTKSVPMEILLGFYLGVILSRWDDYVENIQFPHRDALLVTTYLHGSDYRGRLLRRTYMRYLLLGYIMVTRTLSRAVTRKFPDDEALIKAGRITPDEIKVLESIKTEYNKYMIPFLWAATTMMKAKSEGRVNNDGGLFFINERLSDMRAYTGRLMLLEACFVPLSYTQVLTIAVYTYTLFSLFGGQYSQTKTSSSLEWIFPFGSIFEFIVYVGWLKVAETLINPFGDDDDDFNVCHYIERLSRWSNLVVDELYNQLPDLVRDQYWDNAVFEIELPYTAATIAKATEAQHFELGSAAGVKVSKRMSVVVADSMSRFSSFGRNSSAETTHEEEQLIAARRKSSKEVNTILDIPHSSPTLAPPHGHPRHTDQRSSVSSTLSDMARTAVDNIRQAVTHVTHARPPHLHHHRDKNKENVDNLYNDLEHQF